MSATSRPLLDLERPSGWPPDLQSSLEGQAELFVAWEAGQGDIPAPRYDKAIEGVANALHRHTIVGWHCTRLTEAEAKDIMDNGMRLPDGAMLSSRIDAVVEAGQLAATVAPLLKSANQANEGYRKGRVWFCFYAPRRADERGIERFFRHWGGEALYNSHEHNQLTSPALKAIGTPYIVEGDIPIAFMAPRQNLALNLVDRLLASRGYRQRVSTDHDGYIVQPLPARNVRRVIRFPDPVFLDLTGCAEWETPIT